MPTEHNSLYATGRLTRIVSLLGCILIYALLVRFYFPFPSTVEDSFIVYRYAAHFSAGHGLSWNIGMPHDQGTTGIAWVVMVGTVQTLFHNDPTQAAGYLGLGFGAVTIVLLYLALRRALRANQGYLALTGSLALALTPVFSRHAGSGIDTSLAFLVFAESVYLAMRLPVHRPAVAVALTALAAGLSYLARPDATVFCCSALVMVILMEAPAQSLLLAGAAVVSSVVIVAAETIAIGRYFTTALPLPVYLKISFLELAQNPKLLQQTWRWVMSFQLQLFSTAAIWLAFIALAAASDSKALPRRVRAVLAGALVFYIYLFAVLPIMNFGMRYQAPLLVPLIFAGIVALGGLIGTPGSAGRGRLAAVGALCAVVAFYSFGQAAEMKIAARQATDDHASFMLLGERLRQLPAVRIASTEAGKLAYFSDAPFVDLIGLNDTFVALHHTAPDYDERLERYLASTTGYPDVYARQAGGSGPYADLCTYPRIIARYDYIGNMAGQWPEVFVRRDSEHATRLRELLVGVINAPAPGSAAGCSAASH
jgi:hypothetical protein